MGFLHSFNNLSLRYRLVLSFLIIMMPSLLVLVVVSTTVSTGIVSRLVTESSEMMIDRAAGEINSLLSEVIDVTISFREDPFIQRSLRREFTDLGEQYSLDLEADSELSYISTYKEEIFGLYVIGSNGSSFKSNVRSFREQDFREQQWFHEIMTTDEAVWFTPYEGSMAVKTIGERLFSYGQPVVDKSTGRRNGVILAEVDAELLLNICADRVERGAELFISYPGGILAQSADVETENREFVLTEPLMIPGWELTAVLNIGEVASENQQITLIVAAVFLIVSVFFIIMTWHISGGIVAPIHNIIKQMKLAQEGDLSVSVVVDYDNEIGDLSKNFNRMIRRIKQLIESLNDKHKQLRKSQLEALQAQINPHFLYNTLDSIIWLAREKKNIDIIRTVEALTSLFRIVISRGEDIIPIEREAEHIRNYLIIQHLRYRNKFSYEISIDENVTSFLTLKLILQPVVENAIYHGIKMIREKGHIAIKGYCERENVIFEIADTGPGMSEEQMSELRKVLKNGKSDIIKSYGLKNVQERIDLFFGENFGLDFFSESGKGTTVRIVLPVIQEADDY